VPTVRFLVPGGGKKLMRDVAFGWVLPPVGDRHPHCGEQSPEGEGTFRRRSFGCRRGCPTTGGQRPGMTWHGSTMWFPLKSEPWTWLWDGTSPQGTQRSKPSWAGGTPRTERNVELGALRGRWTLRVDVAKREHGTQGGSLSHESSVSVDGEGGRAGRRLTRTLKRAPARGRMNPTVKRRGTVERTGLVPTVETPWSTPPR
jgi:hypothetical protein